MNKEFIPFELNLTDQPFPETMSALNSIKFVNGLLPFSKVGFTTLSVISPDGKTEYATAGSAMEFNWKNSEHYQGDKCLVMLKAALEKHRKVAKK